MDIHLKCCRANKPGLQSDLLFAERFPFIPGTWQSVAERFSKHPHSNGPYEQTYDPNRKKQILLLDPLPRAYEGLDAWCGYIVFEFSDSNQVVVESFYTGNATYVLSKNWRQMIDHTKAEILHQYEDESTKVNHTAAGWLERVNGALHPVRF